MASAAIIRSKKAIIRVTPASKITKKTFNAANKALKALKALKAKKAIKAKTPPLQYKILIPKTLLRIITLDEINEILSSIKKPKVDLTKLIV